MRRLPVLVSLAVCSSALAASPATKVALVPLPVGAEVSDKAAAAMTEAIAGEIRRVPGVQLITQDEIASLLGLERQKQLLGCSAESCMAELGGALGVDRLVTGTLNKLGETWMFSLKALDVKSVKLVANAQRNLRKGTIDDVIDLISPMVGELFGATPAKGPLRIVDAPAAQPKPEPAAPLKPVAPHAYGPPVKDEPLTPAPDPKSLLLGTDGKGFYLAHPAVPDGFTLFVGDGKSFWRARIPGGSSGGASPKAFDYAAWDPRHQNAGRFAGVAFDGAKYVVQCTREPAEWKPVPEAEARKLLARARFYKPRFRRVPYALARDDAGHYFYVDRTRDEDDAKEQRLYVGTKGKMVGQEIADHVDDSAAEIWVTPAGSLKHPLNTRTDAEWIVSGQRSPLSWLDPENQVELIYGALGVYAGSPLGTPCDPFFK